MIEEKSEIILDIRDLWVNFGGVQAISDFNLSVIKGDITAIIGPNGAGKTTVYNAISRFCIQAEGQIFFKGKDISKLRSHQISSIGIGRTFQRSELCPSLTVFENILMGLHNRRRSGLISEALKIKSALTEETEARHLARKVISMLGLDDYQNSPAYLVPFGIRRIVEIGRAIIFSPDLLLLDEPAAGMNHEEKLKLKEIILGLQKTMKLSIILVEHDMRFVMSIADIVTVLNYGKIIAHSSPTGIMQNPKVIEAYLGEKDS